MIFTETPLSYRTWDNEHSSNVLLTASNVLLGYLKFFPNKEKTMEQHESALTNELSLGDMAENTIAAETLLFSKKLEKQTEL